MQCFKLDMYIESENLVDIYRFIEFLVILITVNYIYDKKKFGLSYEFSL